MEPSHNITALLTSWHQGDPAALDALLSLVRVQVNRIAHKHLHRHRDHAMHPSSLVQEALVRLLPNRGAAWQDRKHFFAVTSQIMKNVLVDHARRHHRVKRGGDAPHVPIDAAAVLSPERLDEVVAIDIALQRLAAFDPRKSTVFEMRFFGGLSVDETADALGVAATTVLRDWRFARAWLRRELSMRDSGHVSLAGD